MTKPPLHDMKLPCLITLLFLAALAACRAAEKEKAGSKAFSAAEKLHDAGRYAEAEKA